MTAVKRITSNLRLQMEQSPFEFLRLDNSIAGLLAGRSQAAAFRQLDLEIDTLDQILWCHMRALGRPSYTLELMDEIGRLQTDIREIFADSPPLSLPIRYCVFGSRTPGIFNLGGDLGHFVSRIQSGDLESMRQYGRVAVTRQHENSIAFGSPVITIALVQGDALGGGFEHALSFDVIVAERSAKMGLPEVLFNMFPGMGAYSFLCRKLDRRRVEEFIMSGRVYTAEELYEIGVVDVLAEDGGGEDAVRAYVAQHQRKFNMHRAVYEARRRASPITLAELIDIVDLWAETAMNVEERDIRMMLRLCAAQDKRVANKSATLNLV